MDSKAIISLPEAAFRLVHQTPRRLHLVKKLGPKLRDDSVQFVWPLYDFRVDKEIVNTSFVIGRERPISMSSLVCHDLIWWACALRRNSNSSRENGFPQENDLSTRYWSRPQKRLVSGPRARCDD